MLRIVCLSDTHGRHDRLGIPDGDLLLHAGDMTHEGRLDEVARTAEWLRGLPHRHKLIIAGNHDYAFEREPAAARALMHGLTYLQDDLVEVEGLRVFGSPWQPWFYGMAFNLERGAALRCAWDRIPAGTDLLITHGPPARHGDLTERHDFAGCVDLLRRIREIGPQLHLFGHIHEGYGVTREGATLCVNASLCRVDGPRLNEPIVLLWDPASRTLTVEETLADAA